MMLVAGYLKIADALPGPVWKCPLSYVAFHTYAIEACNHRVSNFNDYTSCFLFYRKFNKRYIRIFNTVQGLLENEYVGTSFAVGQVRAISGVQAVHASYDISPSRNAKWGNLLALFLMAVGYRALLFVLLRFNVRKNIVNCNFCCLKMNTTKSRWMNHKLCPSPNMMFEAEKL